jgi:hypothetical protein
MVRTGRLAALLAISAALVVPAIAAAGEGPVATKSGAIVNYVSGPKLKVGKLMQILIVSPVNCNVTSTSVIKGPGAKVPGNVSGPLQANVPGGPTFKPNGPLLRELNAFPGRFKLVNTITATDPATGATDTISRVFKFKR